MIGFKPMWAKNNSTQENELREGANTVTAANDGILSFIFVKRNGYDTEPVTVDVKVVGGKAIPFYVSGQTEDQDWENAIKKMEDTYVQLVSDRVLITLPSRDYVRYPIEDVEAMFETIHKMIDLDDQLAGFDDSSPENMRTRNRLNYLVDVYTPRPESDKYYAYAGEYFIGMKRDNFTALTRDLGTEWGYWHETGHFALPAAKLDVRLYCRDTGEYVLAIRAGEVWPAVKVKGERIRQCGLIVRNGPPIYRQSE